MTDRRFLIIGLDCFTPQFVFDQWKDQLPNIKGLIEKGTWGVWSLLKSEFRILNIEYRW